MNAKIVLAIIIVIIAVLAVVVLRKPETPQVPGGPGGEVPETNVTTEPHPQIIPVPPTFNVQEELPEFPESSPFL